MLRENENWFEYFITLSSPSIRKPHTKCFSLIAEYLSRRRPAYVGLESLWMWRVGQWAIYSITYKFHDEVVDSATRGQNIARFCINKTGPISAFCCGIIAVIFHYFNAIESVPHFHISLPALVSVTSYLLALFTSKMPFQRSEKYKIIIF